ncbi:hypothetical protein BGW38_002042, partial [Lunasporangiospora selenospora]
AKNLGLTNGVVYIRGGDIKHRDDTDVELVFRQESNFYYLTGCAEPGAHVLYDLKTNKATLFVYQLTPHELVWDGLQPTLAKIQEEYDLDDDAIVQARIYKSEYEIEIMRRINKISSDAHIALMKAVKTARSEGDLDALFRYETARAGARIQAYKPIVGAGANASTLHYGRNTSSFATRPEDNNSCRSNDDSLLVLVDAGAELDCYASDITRTYPVQGQFSEDAKVLYSIVLEMQKTVLGALRPGVEWEAMHRLAGKVAVEGLQRAGVLKQGYSVQEMLEHHVDGLFFTHGLGHMIGLDVHDVGGYPRGVERLQAPGIKYLRMRRPLEAGFVVTVEPGVYFTEYLLEEARRDERRSKYVDWDVVSSRFMKLGGVRIEDSVVITETGIDNLTVVPKEIEEIEAILAGRA